MYVEGLEREFGAQDESPEGFGGPDPYDPDRPPAPDISTLAGANVTYAQFGQPEGGE